MTTLEKVTEILHRTVLIEKTTITKDTRFNDDLGLDYLDKLEIVKECEKEFRFDAGYHFAFDMRKVGELVSHIENRL